MRLLPLHSGSHADLRLPKTRTIIPMITLEGVHRPQAIIEANPYKLKCVSYLTCGVPQSCISFTFVGYDH